MMGASASTTAKHVAVEAAAPTNADEALQTLLDGNARFVAGAPLVRDVRARRAQLLSGQHPHATVLSCSDSRVVPEALFDAGLGELFVVRTAGNVAGAVGLGSLEYGCAHLHTPLLVVLAHSRCGAVTAAVNAASGKKDAAHAEDDHEEAADLKLSAMVCRIVEATKEEAVRGDVDGAIRHNARGQAEGIVARSPVIRSLVEKGKLRVCTLFYDLESGKVSQF